MSSFKKMNNTSPVVSLTFFSFPLKNLWWALKQMQQANSIIEKFDGVSFVKLLGTGGGEFGFSIKPDLRTYALLCVWHNAEKAKNLEKSSLFLQLTHKSSSYQTLYMACTQSHGAWGGLNPLKPTTEYVSGPLYALTRASLSPSKIIAFWQHVPDTIEALRKSSGLISSKGVGELPVIEQATFSQWQTAEDMMNFAYRSAHTQVLKKAKKGKWFKEELFARFIPINLGEW